MSDFAVLEDCDGLKFQHGPHIEFSFDKTEGGLLHLQVSNPHDLLFVSQNKTICIYRLSSVILSVVAKQPYHSHRLDHLGFQEKVNRIHLVPKLNLLAVQLSQKLVFYDFSQGSEKFESELDATIEDVKWTQKTFFVRDANHVLYAVNMDGTKKEIMTQCSMIASKEEDGILIACSYNDKLELKVLRDNSDARDTISIKLPEDYEAFEQKSIAGCAIISETLFMIGMVLDGQDSLLMLCELEGNTANLIHWGFNELFLNPEDVECRIEFQWIEEWKCLFAWSNIATMVIMISNNPKIVEDRSWSVINMKEGYCLESLDIDCCPTDLAVCTTYRDQLYRKKASEDVPLLTNPSVFLLAQGSSRVSLNYADTWVIDKHSNELEVLPRLGNKDDGSLADSFKEHKKGQFCTSETSAAIPEDANTSTNQDFDDLCEYFGSSSFMKSSTFDSHPKTSLFSKMEETRASIDTTVSNIKPQGASDGKPGMKDDRCSDAMPLDEGVIGIVKYIHENAFNKYVKLNADKEIKLERLRLTEMLCNCFHLFEDRLRDLESVQHEAYIDPPTIIESSSAEAIEYLEKVQKKISSDFNSISRTSTIGRETTAVTKEMGELYDKALEFYTRRMTADGFELDLYEMESQFNCVHESLKIMNQKLDEYEKRLEIAEHERCIKTTQAFSTYKERLATDVATEKFTIPDIDGLLKQMKETHIVTPMYDTVDYNDRHVKYSEYTTAESNLLLKKDDQPLPAFQPTTQQGFSLDISTRQLFQTETTTYKAEDARELKADYKEPGSSATTSSVRLEPQPTEAKTPTRIETSAVKATEPNSEENKTSSVVSYAGWNKPDQSQDGTPSLLNPQISSFGYYSPKKEESAPSFEVYSSPFQRQSYTFGDNTETSNTFISGSVKPINSFTGSTTFASFAGTTSFSFASLAASKDSGGLFNVTNAAPESNKPFGNTSFKNIASSDAFHPANSSTRFDSVASSPFLNTSGTFNIGSIKDAAAKNSGSSFSSDLWSSSRRSNPLD